MLGNGNLIHHATIFLYTYMCNMKNLDYIELSRYEKYYYLIKTYYLVRLIY